MTPWFRESAGEAYRRFAVECRLPRTMLAEFMGLNPNTLARLESGKPATPQVARRLVKLDMIDAQTAEPNLTLARKLRPLAKPSKRALRHARPPEPKYPHGIGELIYAYRSEYGVYQHQLAKELGISKAAVSAFETNERMPPPNVLVRMTMMGIVPRDRAVYLLDQVYPLLTGSPGRLLYPRANRGILVRAERDHNLVSV